MERKITAILAVDVAGFSKMMQEDEERTLELLKNRREIIDFEKLKIPTRNSLFYHAATLSNMGETDRAQNVLTQAESMSGIGVQEFMEGQKYKDHKYREQLATVLISISSN